METSHFLFLNQNYFFAHTTPSSPRISRAHIMFTATTDIDIEFLSLNIVKTQIQKQYLQILLKFTLTWESNPRSNRYRQIDRFTIYREGEFTTA